MLRCVVSSPLQVPTILRSSLFPHSGPKSAGLGWRASNQRHSPRCVYVCNSTLSDNLITCSSLCVCGAGQYYFEARVTDEGLCRVGWAAAVNLFGWLVGVTAQVFYSCVPARRMRKETLGLTHYLLGTLGFVPWIHWHAVARIHDAAHAFSYGGTGKKSHNRNFEDYGESFGLKDVIGCCLDRTRYVHLFLPSTMFAFRVV